MALDPHDLDAAMPTLVDKLKDLRKQLGEAEVGAFDEIIRSAALHTDSTLQSQGAGAMYTKPISATATMSMKQQMVNLPSILQIPEEAS